MPYELTISASGSYAKGLVSRPFGKGGLQITVSGTNVHSTIQNVGITEEQIAFGDVATPGYCYLRNLDPTNYIEIRPATAVADLIKLKPGEIALFRLAADCTAPFAIANTAGCELEIMLFED